jgi:hypothetical protein
MKNDPGETRNLARDSDHSDTVRQHQKLLEEWESKLDRAPNALPPFKAS